MEKVFYSKNTQGEEVVVLRFLHKAQDMIGRPITIAMDMTDVEAPQGNRLVTTAYIFLGQDHESSCSGDTPYQGEYGVYTGAAVQSPNDDHNYESALIQALYRAGKVMVAERLKDYDLQQWDWSKSNCSSNSDSAIKRWSKRLVRKMSYEHGSLDQVARDLDKYVLATTSKPLNPFDVLMKYLFSG